MNWQTAIGILSTIALFSPVVVILVYRLFRYKNYMALFFYCFFAFAYNIMSERYLILPGNVERIFGMFTNLLDAPLLLFFLMVFSTSAANTKWMKILLLLFIVFEIIIIALKGLNLKSITIIMGPGLFLVFGYALYYFVQTIKRSFIHAKAVSKALMASAICFANGCFIFVYLMYYVYDVPGTAYIFIVYFTITIIYCSLLSVGLVQESKRKRKLEEVLHTRKELLQFFADEKKPAIFKK